MKYLKENEYQIIQGKTYYDIEKDGSIIGTVKFEEKHNKYVWIPANYSGLLTQEELKEIYDLVKRLNK